MIPKSNVNAVGLRQVVNKKQVNEIYKILKRKEVSKDNNQTWNRRYRQYTEMIKTGSVFEIAEVFRILFRLKKVKELSFGEKKILDTAQNLLVKEISIAKNQEEKVVQEEMDTILTS